MAVPNRGRGGKPHRPWLRRVGWMLLIWVASVAALGAAALLLRLLMRAAGMHS